MKNQLTLEDLACYLPYSLTWSLQGLKTFTMTGITHETLYTEEGTVLTWSKHPDLPQALFPLLRPLSQLTEEIEHNGERFVPLLKLLSIDDSYNSFEFVRHQYLNGVNVRVEYEVDNYGTHSGILGFFSFDSAKALPYNYIKKLLMWHFDIEGELISSGLAIEIPSLKEEEKV